MTAAASGPATARRSSAAPCGRMAATSGLASSRMNDSSQGMDLLGPERARERSRWRACCAPSSESMLGPTTLAVENRGSSTVNVRASRSTSTASW